MKFKTQRGEMALLFGLSLIFALGAAKGVGNYSGYINQIKTQVVKFTDVKSQNKTQVARVNKTTNTQYVLTRYTKPIKQAISEYTVIIKGTKAKTGTNINV